VTLKRYTVYGFGFSEVKL